MQIGFVGLGNMGGGSVDAPVPMGGAAEKLYATFVEAGNGGTDFSGIIKML